MKYLAYILISTLAIGLWSCGGDKQADMHTAPAIPVTVEKVIATSGSASIFASGQVEAESSANLSTRLMGHVTRLHIKVGDRVRKGDLLISINTTDLEAKKAQVEASIIQAQAGYDNAKKDYERFQSLYEQGSASQKELDDMTTRFQMAEAGLKAAQHMKKEIEAHFTYAEIRSPFSGVVINTFVKEGDMANPGMPLVSVESTGSQQVAAMVSESDIKQIRKGLDVKVNIKSLDKMVDGTVTEVSRSAKNTGGQYLVKIDLDEEDESILSGMFVNVAFPVAQEYEGSRISIPTSSLVKKGQLTGVYTIGADDTAILRWLRTGKVSNEQVEVLSGLAANETFIAKADGRLYNGAKVSIQ